MPRLHYALAVPVFLACLSAGWGQIALSPQAGLLVLRNGQVLEGNVTRAGDYYIVTLGGTSEIRLPAADVEAVCGSLDEAYEFKLRHLSGSGARPHLELAEWCLRQQLHARCAEQLVSAMRLEPQNPTLKLLERRLEFAALPPKTDQPKTAAASEFVGTEQVEKTIRALPGGSVEKFAAVVQPILLNRCGANQCHGPNSKAEFRLLRPAPGQLASRRFTERNLYAALQQLDSSHPDSSPLVALPQQRHGSSLTAVFDKHSQQQLDELVAWVKLTLAAPQSNPATIAVSSPTLSQAASATATPPATPKDNAAAAAAAAVRALKPAADSSPSSPPADPNHFVPRDRFDPEIFNRRFPKS
ncbi:MAG TPA: hypothetical protein VFV87_04345 [Pirellulaceae bacterium]|nr:hypothetical protein [Pirellulaceae bacterium]